MFLLQRFNERSENERSKVVRHTGFDAAPAPSEALLIEILQQELFDSAANLFAMGLEREMAGVQHMYFEILQIALIGRSAFRWEDEIVLAPDDQRRRLILAEKGLKLGIQRNVGSVGMHQIHLDIEIPRAIQAHLIHHPRRGVE